MVQDPGRAPARRVDARGPDVLRARPGRGGPARAVHRPDADPRGAPPRRPARGPDRVPPGAGRPRAGRHRPLRPRRPRDRARARLRPDPLARDRHQLGAGPHGARRARVHAARSRPATSSRMVPVLAPGDPPAWSAPPWWRSTCPSGSRRRCGDRPGVPGVQAAQAAPAADQGHLHPAVPADDPRHRVLGHLVRALPRARHHRADPAAGPRDARGRGRQPRLPRGRPGGRRGRHPGGVLQPDDAGPRSPRRRSWSWPTPTSRPSTPS